jgi:DNA-binding CsgD family transcriptional regulator
VLIGRAEERTRVDELLKKGRVGMSAALIVHGDPGIGKSRLLEYLIAEAEGFIVLRAHPLEAEVELPFAGLSDLLRPLLPLLDRVPAPQAGALSAALALGPPAPGDRFAVAAATLSMLALGAEAAPLLVAVDDAHWLDGPSREALLFAARRLGREGVLVVLASRDLPWLEAAGIDRLAITGLTENEAGALIDESKRAISAGVREQLIGDTAGNPLAILEALDVLSDAQLAGTELIASPLPVGDDLGHGFVRKLEPLPADTRAALLVAAASDTGDLREIARALATLGLEQSALAPGVGEGLIAIQPTLVEFSHPLVRSAVYHAATPADRHAAHKALAHALSPDAVDRFAWHLASSTGEPDEEVAALLEASANAAQVRLGYSSAALAYETAARLSPADADRVLRTMAAAQAHWLGGSPDRVDDLLLAILPLAIDPALRADIQLLRAGALFFIAPVGELYTLLATEGERIASVDPARAAVMFCHAAGCCLMAGELIRSVETARRAFVLAQPLGGPVTARTAGVLAGYLVFRGAIEEGTAILEPLLSTLDEVDPLGASQDMALIAQGLSFLEDFERAERTINRVILAARDASAPSLLPFPLAVLSEHELRRGRVAAAHAAAAESVRLVHETGQTAAAAFSLVTLARVEAILGLEDQCREHVATGRAVSRKVGAATIEWYGEAVLGLLDLSLGNAEQAYAHTLEAARLELRMGSVLPVIVPLRPDLIEAAIRLGRLDDAARELELFEQQGRETGISWIAATAARCRGLIDDESTYERTFAEALVLHGNNSPWERARTELCLGRRRRRSRRRADARASLRSALAIFESLGGEPWAEETRKELRATGLTVTPTNDSSLRDLTPQELQVTLIIAKGATTKQAAAALFLSPKTIEFHLANTYRKLGLSSRTELVRRVERLDVVQRTASEQPQAVAAQDGIS